MDGMIRLNVVNVITICIAVLLGYGILVGSTLLLKQISPGAAA